MSKPLIHLLAVFFCFCLRDEDREDLWKINGRFTRIFLHYGKYRLFRLKNIKITPYFLGGEFDVMLAIERWRHEYKFAWLINRYAPIIAVHCVNPPHD